MEKIKGSKIVLIDYDSFNATNIYADSINELTDILFKKQYEVYALLGTDSNKPIPAIDASISGVIPYRTKNIANSGKIISEAIYRTIKGIEEDNILVISSNPLLLSTIEQFGYKVCLINNGYNDTVSLSGTEVNHIYKLNKTLR